ncbi:hypothetical protein O6H91_05G039200 [Diphasiastrum complanatum]|uniref:Uncharacterized protein n=1 Tax=Diphasiastrum complanatum TaxID=34168 RepID=A0ACC2DMC8_DIPCM|nr:hypothetical protein O6H91_05G039200 [Diphasiastrum complanatum]
MRNGTAWVPWSHLLPLAQLVTWYRRCLVHRRKRVAEGRRGPRGGGGGGLVSMFHALNGWNEDGTLVGALTREGRLNSWTCNLPHFWANNVWPNKRQHSPGLVTKYEGTRYLHGMSRWVLFSLT